jgi:hypothetical protein
MDPLDRDSFWQCAGTFICLATLLLDLIEDQSSDVARSVNTLVPEGDDGMNGAVFAEALKLEGLQGTVRFLMFSTSYSESNHMLTN